MVFPSHFIIIECPGWTRGKIAPSRNHLYFVHRSDTIVVASENEEGRDGLRRGGSREKVLAGDQTIVVILSVVNMSRKVRMGRLADLAGGEAIEMRILAHRYAVIRVNGELHGIEADCKHMRASLVKGTVRDGVITCPWHGWRYDVESGQCLTDDKFKLRKYEVEVDSGDIYLVID